MSHRNLESISHPELELRMKVIGNEYSSWSAHVPHQTMLDVLEVYPNGQVVEKEGIGHEEFANYCSSLDGKHLEENTVEEREPLLRVIFLQDLFIPPVIDINDPSLPPRAIMAPNMSDSTAHLLHRYFGVPMIFLQDLIPVITYRTIGNATFIRKNKEGKATSIDGYYQLCSEYLGNKVSYTWFSQSLEKGKASNYVIHKCPTVAKTLVLECAKRLNPLSLARPFVIDAFLMNDCVMRMNNEMMEPRQRLIKIEQTDFDEPLQSQSAQQIKNLNLLHSIAREFRLMRDTLSTVKDTIEYIMDIQNQHPELTLVGSARTENPAMDSVQESFSILKSKANWITRELSSLVDRAGLKIGLEYSLENQRDSRTHFKIARLTKDIAAAAQKDSSAMITMAAVTMFFLPGTFVSAIFSMAFFSSSGNDGKFGVAHLWWLFPAITIPLTICVFLVWIVWRRHRDNMKTKKLEQSEAMQDLEMSLGEDSKYSFAEDTVPTKWYRRLSTKLFGPRASAQQSSVLPGKDNFSSSKKAA